MRLLPQEIIRKKRDGGTLEADEIQAFIQGLTDGSISEGQVAALAMAVFFRGMGREETVALTRAMSASGRTLRWDDLPGPVVDKHSTGGVGDKVSLILAPVLAACGVYVPMLSGRGLGHTGGTLDKLESIPGYRTAPDPDHLRRTVAAAGCAIIGQTDDLAPADRRLYAIRDVTATVESIPLITASILSKKLAAGPQSLVMDVKTGSGAFMRRLEDAQALATSIVEVARGAGLACSALITDMNQCLGWTAGNALEVGEAVAVLRGEPAEPRLREVTLALCGEALLLAKLVASPEEGRAKAETALASGRAAERFGVMVRELGGPADFVQRPGKYLPQAAVVRPVFAPVEGYVHEIDVRGMGLCVVQLGGGRRRASDGIDPSVGLSAVKRLGDRVTLDKPLALIHGSDESGVAAAAERLRRAYIIGPETPDLDSLVLDRIT